MDHDKVLIKMDGSRRLTTRNRRFVKKIISPQDLPDQVVVLDPPVPIGLGVADKVPTAQVDIEDTVGMDDESVMEQQGMGQYETGTGGRDIPNEEQIQGNDHQDIRVAEGW